MQSQQYFILYWHTYIQFYTSILVYGVHSLTPRSAQGKKGNDRHIYTDGDALMAILCTILNAFRIRGTNQIIKMWFFRQGKQKELFLFSDFDLELYLEYTNTSKMVILHEFISVLQKRNFCR